MGFGTKWAVGALVMTLAWGSAVGRGRAEDLEREEPDRAARLEAWFKLRASAARSERLWGGGIGIVGGLVYGGLTLARPETSLFGSSPSETRAALDASLGVGLVTLGVA